MDRLAELLERAYEDSSARREFLLEILKAEVVVPVLREESSSAVVVGQVSPELVLSRTEGKVVLAVFSCEALAEAWASESVSCERRAFAKLIWLLGEETWLHLNPGEEYGKEFSPWEISQLRLGEDAVEDILHEISDERDEGISVVHKPQGLDGLKKQLRALLEVYQGIEEAFLIEVNYPKGPELVLGLRESEVANEKKSQLQEEIAELRPLKVIWKGDFQGGLFEGATPFYLKTH